jgi:hypothetical protein
MLAAHPEMWVPPESYWIERVVGVRPRLERGATFDQAGFLAELGADQRFLAWGLPLDAVESALAEAPPADLADAVRRVFEAYSRSEGRTRWADKTPIYVLIMESIAGLLPEARFVHLIRDGRDVAASYASVPWGPRSFTTAATRWRRHVTAGRRSGRVLGPERYLELRYERLVEAPEAELARLCAFLDLEFTPQMLDYSGASERILRATSHTEHVAGVRDPLDPQRRSWRQSSSPEQAAWFEAVAGPLRAELGYPAGPEPSSVQRLLGGAVTRAVGGFQWTAETTKRSRPAMVARPLVRTVKARLGLSVG